MTDVLEELIAEKVVQNHGDALKDLLFRRTAGKITDFEFDTELTRLKDIEQKQLTAEDMERAEILQRRREVAAIRAELEDVKQGAEDDDGPWEAA